MGFFDRVVHSFMERRVLFSVLAILILFAAPALPSTEKAMIKVGFEGVLSRDGVPGGWKLRERAGNAEYRVVTIDGERFLYFRGDNASFSMERELRLDVREYPLISWKWKIMLLPAGGDVRYRGRNDQAAQVIVLFDKGKAISYIWDTNAPEGTVREESVPWPFSIKIKVLVVKSGVEETRKWVVMRRNIYEDFRRLFREEPGPVKGVRIQLNSQHTGTIGETFFGPILFEQK